jgi:hypothetical protein
MKRWISIPLLAILLGLIYGVCTYHQLAVSLTAELNAIDFSSFKKPFHFEALEGKGLWLASYADGDDIYKVNQSVVHYSAINKGFDHFLMFRRHHIDQAFYKKNKQILDVKRGAGLWLWRPYFINKALHLMPEGDYLVYADAGFMFTRDIKELITLAREHDIVVFSPVGYRNIQHVKRHAMTIAHVDLPAFRNSPEIVGRLLVIKNTKRAREWISGWLELCQNPDVIMDTQIGENEWPEFKLNLADQSCLNIMHFKSPFPYKYIFSFHHNYFPGDVFSHQRTNTQEWPSVFVGYERLRRYMAAKDVAKSIKLSRWVHKTYPIQNQEKGGVQK